MWIACQEPGGCSVRRTVHIKPKTVHRMTAVEDSVIFEVSTPELDDLVRLEDSYGGKTSDGESGDWVIW
jgi:hypothetical protein